jgi:hypothetical protein
VCPGGLGLLTKWHERRPPGAFSGGCFVRRGYGLSWSPFCAAGRFLRARISSYCYHKFLLFFLEFVYGRT